MACGAVACEYLGTVIKVGSEGCGCDGHDADNNGSGDLCHNSMEIVHSSENDDLEDNEHEFTSDSL